MKKQILRILAVTSITAFSMIWHACQKESDEIMNTLMKDKEFLVKDLGFLMELVNQKMEKIHQGIDLFYEKLKFANDEKPRNSKPAKNSW